MLRKLIIFTAPSGAGKTTIVKHLLAKYSEKLAFSVSATSRESRVGEKDGVDYYFLSPDTFKQKITNNDFLEYEEVYENQYYGTLKSEIERLWAIGKCVLFDVDVKGATRIKQAYPDETLAIFVKPPSEEILYSRLQLRRTETPASLEKRIKRVAEELTYENKFDAVLLNDKLEKALADAEQLVNDFLQP